ncbi:hypothetical protein Q3G72_022284 [Acer saccharum]|nr:hypothetical protein Q3G72_022284 [Acer saccharum]
MIIMIWAPMIGVPEANPPPGGTGIHPTLTRSQIRGRYYVNPLPCRIFNDYPGQSSPCGTGIHPVLIGSIDIAWGLASVAIRGIPTSAICHDSLSQVLGVILQ